MHTRKLGLGFGVKWGRGWLLMRTALDPPHWSAPVFYNVKEGSFGFTAGRLHIVPFTSLSPCHHASFTLHEHAYTRRLFEHTHICNCPSIVLAGNDECRRSDSTYQKRSMGVAESLSGKDNNGRHCVNCLGPD